MSLKRMRVEREGKNGWSRWVQPVMRNYIMACCDCGLAHRMEFRVIRVEKKYADGRIVGKKVKGHIIHFRAKRAKRYTEKNRKIRALKEKK